MRGTFKVRTSWFRMHLCWGRKPKEAEADDPRKQMVGTKSWEERRDRLQITHKSFCGLFETIQCACILQLQMFTYILTSYLAFISIIWIITCVIHCTIFAEEQQCIQCEKNLHDHREVTYLPWAPDSLSEKWDDNINTTILQYYTEKMSVNVVVVIAELTMP